VDSLNDGTLEEEETEDSNIAISNQVLAGSAAWAGKMLRQCRQTGPVTNDSEKRFFADNYIQFLKTTDDTEADNYSSFAWARFSLFWNGIIAEEEAGRRPTSNMRLKSAFHLQAYCKKFRREANARATLLDVHRADKSMRREYRGLCRDTAISTLPVALSIQDVSRHLPTDDDCDENSEFGIQDDDSVVEEAPQPQPKQAPPPASVAAALSQPTSNKAPVHQTAVSTSRVEVPLFPSRRKLKAPTVDHPLEEQEAGPPKKKREPRRCRNCGNTYKHGSDFKKYHVGLGRSSGWKDPSAVCATPDALRAEGFPLEKGKRMKRKRAPPPGPRQWN
jgi:hypothetical protein